MCVCGEGHHAAVMGEMQGFSMIIISLVRCDLRETKIKSRPGIMYLSGIGEHQGYYIPW